MGYTDAMQKWVIGLGMLLGLWGTGAGAVVQTISGMQGQCRLFYPSPKNLTGWTMTTPVPCPGGRVHGQGKVTLMNAFRKPEEELGGFFSQGYWTDVLITSPLQSVPAPEESPTLSFLLAQDVHPDVLYFGYMTAKKSNPLYYSSFRLCTGTQVVVQTREDSRDSGIQKQIGARMTQAVKALCPAVKKITVLIRETDGDVPRPYGVLDVERNIFKLTSVQEKEAEEESLFTPPKVADPGATQPPVVKASLPVGEGMPPLSNPYHLFLKSKVTGQKVFGRARVHITDDLRLDAPVTGVILGAVSPGWGLAEGYFLETQGQAPIIQVTSWQVLSGDTP